MAEKNSEKINFNVPPSLKRDIECLASSHGKTLSAFMLDVCSILVKNNSARIREQKKREQEPINFGEVKQKKITTKNPTQSDSNMNGADDNE